MSSTKIAMCALALASASALHAEDIPAAGLPAAPLSLEAYGHELRNAHDAGTRLAAALEIQVDSGDTVVVTHAWAEDKALKGGREALDALELRVQVARRRRPAAFEPDEVHRRLVRLLDRLYPTRIRGLGQEADTPVAAGPLEWYTTTGTTGAGGGGVIGGGGQPVGGGYVRPAHTRHGHPHGNGGGTGGGIVTAVNTTTSTNPYRPHRTVPQQTVQTFQTQPPRSTYTPAQTRQIDPQTTPVQVQNSRPTEVASVPPPRPPAVQPPPPPPQPLIQPKKSETSWLTVLLLIALALAPVLAYIAWRARRKGAPAPKVAPPRSVADLVDPEHVGLDPAALGAIGRQSAMDEDWMRAMRYLFAALLTYLAQQRQVPIRDWHTNLEIAGLVGRDAKLSESFWSAATIFELFWFGQRQPMENDFRMFEMMARDCMQRFPGVAE